MNNPLNQDVEPWYRQRWPWLLMLGPFIVIVASAVTAYMAVKSSDGLVEDDYYKQGLEINQIAARDQKADELGLQAEIMRGESMGGQQSGVIWRVILSGRDGVALPERMRLRLVHPTRPGVDQEVALLAEGQGVYSGKSAALTNGRWQIILEDEGKTWRLAGERKISESAPLRLSSSAAEALN